MAKIRSINLSIKQRLYGGFIILFLTLLTAVGLTIVKVGDASDGIDRISTLRVPTANASAKMVSDINGSLASLRGWMLTGNETFKSERSVVWASITKGRASMDKLSKTWTNPDNVKNWNEFKTILDEFEIAQQKVEDIANSPNEQPALVILLIEAAPQATIITSAITAMIDEEAGLNATAERKALLGMMADVRGTMGLSLANIRAMLLTGDQAFVDLFDGLWAKNERRFADLSNSTGIMTKTQRAEFDKLVAAREIFAPLPTKMFEIRSSAQWNMANYVLVTEAAPRAGKLLTILTGPKAVDGSRTGGMVANQKSLLTNDADTQMLSINDLQNLEWLLLVVGVVIAGCASFFTVRAIVGPIENMVLVMKRLADKDYEVEVTGAERKDEIGAMAKAVEFFKSSGMENEQMIGEREENRKRMVEEEEQKRKDEQEREIMAQEQRAEQERLAAEKQKQDRLELAQKFEEHVMGVIDGVSGSAASLNDTSQSMASAAKRTQEKSIAASSATNQAGSNVQAVASASEEMSASVSEISRQVSDAASVANGAVSTADSAAERVNTLSAAAEKIGAVVSLINDIAEQTNLLALNATIEAARAGDAGKGFAVVASEVKSLATQTGKATEEIAHQIEGMQGATTGAVSAVNEISKTIGQINEISTAIAAAVEEQSAATNEISRNAVEAATGTEEVGKNVSEVNQMASETEQAANDVLSAANELSDQSTMLRDEVDSFLAEVRAG